MPGGTRPWGKAPRASEVAARGLAFLVIPRLTGAMDHDSFTTFAHRLADCAADETLPRFRQDTAVSNKDTAGFDPVTEGDRAAERVLRTMIEADYPDHAIRGEEFREKPAQDGSPWRWVLDPIDGTRAFICGVPVWTTLIGLEKDGVPVAGIIDQPFLRERWIGSLFDGDPRLSTSTNLPAKTSGRTDIAAARMMVTDMRAGEYFSDHEANAVARLAGRVQVVRQGLDSYGFGLVASGQMDLVVEAGLHWHDIAAVVPVIKAAGGTVITWQGKDLQATDGPITTIAAATQALAREAAAILRG
ncbi:MAG: inositol monophosphatase family protein [Pseudomonadota bacterium]